MQEPANEIALVMPLLTKKDTSCVYTNASEKPNDDKESLEQHTGDH